MKILFFLFPLFACFILESCVPSKPSYDEESVSFERLITKIEANRRRIKNFEGTGEIKITSKRFNNSAFFIVKFQRPDSLYFEVLGPFGIQLAQSVISVNDFLFYDIMNDVAYKGANNSNILNRIIGVNIDFNDLLDAFKGSANLTEILFEKPSDIMGQNDSYVLTYLDTLNGETAKIKILLKEMAMSEYSKYYDDGGLKYRVEYDKFYKIDDYYLPYNIKALVEDQILEISYKSIKVNSEKINLSVRIPSDVKIIEWNE